MFEPVNGKEGMTADFYEWFDYGATVIISMLGG
jgi:hypothetical protein